MKNAKTKWPLVLAAVLALTIAVPAKAMPVDGSLGKFSQKGLRLTPVAEGLYESAVPAVLTTAWANTFLIYGEDSKADTAMVGTAYPIMKKRIGKLNYVMLLTAGHVGDPVDKLDPDNGDVLTIASDGKVHFVDNGGEPTFTGELTFQLQKIQTSVELDASAILITVADDTFAAITPFHFPAQGCAAVAVTGAKNYIVGFPAVSDRPVANQNVKIVDPAVVSKRWSEGFLTDELGYDDFQENARNKIPLIGSTADGLEGNSGSPTVDASGNLIGMLNAGDDDAHYTGNEQSTPMKSYSYLAPCDKLQKFASDKWAAMTR